MREISEEGKEKCGREGQREIFAVREILVIYLLESIHELTRVRRMVEAAVEPGEEETG